MRSTRSRGEVPVGCAAQGMSRRRFLTDCAACAGAAGLMASPKWLQAAGGSGPKIRIIYALHGPKQEVPDWPNKGFDFVPVMDRINTALANRFKDFTFLPAMAAGEEEAKKILEGDKTGDIDGYIVYQMNCWNRVVQTTVTSGKPVLYADFQFAGSGGFLVYTAGFLRERRSNLGFVASSRQDDLFEAVRCFEAAKSAGPTFDFASATAKVRSTQTPRTGDLACLPDKFKILTAEETIRRMKAAKIIAVRGPEADPETTMMGIPIVSIPFSELNAAWAAANKDEARAVADRWLNTASRVEGVSREELVNSAAMYLGEKAVLKKHGAMGITINCLGGFYGNHIHAYPCLGFHELNNEGLVGGCECDVPSAAAMVAGAIMTGGRPGYISDPVIDTAKRQIIYAHCVASNRAFGPKGEANPFEILTHSEDRQGASVRSVLPVGYLTTTVEISDSRKEIILHQAKAVGNDPDDRACRTKLAAEPLGDIEKLFTMWDKWGWHRVTFYGDLKKSVTDLAAGIGWTVVEEA
ncbi:MAG: hypothetical protein H6P98_448 [Candidatus Aminicenantes bacterium]|nr:hypothetical protein [Candidatus Aminicenantes bacterium]